MATDTIQSDTPAIDGGKQYAQFFASICSLLSDVHGMKSLASFLGVLMDQIIDCGAPTKLISDSAKVETSNAVQDIFARMVCLPGKVNHTNNTRTQLRGGTSRWSNACAILSLTSTLATLP
jgi:hypothetical protein